MDAIVLPVAASPSPRFLSSFRRHPSPATVSASPCRQRESVRCKAFSRRSLSAGWNVSPPVVAGPHVARIEELDATNMLLRQRIVFMGSPVDTESADFIVSQLLLLDAEDSEKDIKLFINSPGGSPTAGMGIYDAMKQCKADVSTVCFGIAASIAAFILAGGTKGKRFCMPNSRVMLHQPTGSSGPDETYVNSVLRLREVYLYRDKMMKTLSKITGKPVRQILTDTAFDFFMSPWDAVEYGVVDAVIDDGKPGLVAPVAELREPPPFGTWYLWDSKMGATNLSEMDLLVPRKQEQDNSKEQPSPV